MSEEKLIVSEGVGAPIVHHPPAESAGIEKLAAALAKAQSKFRNPEKNRTVKVTHKAGGSHSYSYATLDVVLDCVRGPLSENGLAFIQLVTNSGDQPMLITKLIHESGQQLESIYYLPKGLGVQEFGAAITYARRYSACPMLGICGETDTDAEQAEENERAQVEVKQAEAVERLKEMAKKGRLTSAETGKPVTPEQVKVAPPQAPAPTEPEKTKEPEDNIPMDYPKIDGGLAAALKKSGITLEQFKKWGVDKKNFPDTMDMVKLNPTFLAAVLKPSNWDKVVNSIKGGK